MDFKRYTVLIVIALLFVSTIVGCIGFASAQSGTQVGGTLNHNANWSQAGSPYSLTSDLTIQKGGTLTIESGVQVNFIQDIPTHDSYGRPTDQYVYHSLEVDGTLIAIGQSAPITFNYGENIIFNSSPNSILQNINFLGQNDGANGYSGYNINIQDSSLKFIQNSLNTVYPSNGISISGGSPILENNKFGSNVGIGVSNSNAQINNNTVRQNNQWQPIKCFISLYKSPAIVSNNNISAYYQSSSLIVDSGAPMIEGNFVDNYNAQHYTTPSVGLTIYGNANLTVENNTFAQNDIALNIYDSNGSPSSIIEYNNFEQNGLYNVYLGEQNVFGTTAPNVNASNNWWGTTDTAIIGQTIFDHKNNNNLGTVTFNPLLTSENNNAFPNSNSQISSPTNPTGTPNNQSINPTTSVTPSDASAGPIGSEPTIPQAWLYGIIVVLIGVITALSIGFLVYRRKVTSQAQK